ncbi:MAG TPA: nuclear transport factor 2 family protein [Bradyrhizobium sp.]|uniref:nuclear transport factor 2 family protein n=1 Tax=Bradyrhizobium sp. TaxID=376 RepID=UPI002B9E9A61|nr:nuclear transport factor 2 family protein [Bradyrhizobium sp.]HLZ03523.1 nuclear transport factor 2 family protein [Bradyrhizobium sp.]
MPSMETLRAFAATVEANDHVGAIERFYAPDASTRENENPPISGRDVLAAKERATLARVASVKTTRIGPLLLDGDRSAIRWRFEFTAKDGSVRAMEEVAWQTWRGEQLIEEHFFYDPAMIHKVRTAVAAE